MTSKPLPLPPALAQLITPVRKALDARATIDKALADKRDAMPDAAKAGAEAERLAAEAETELALVEADAALGGTGQGRAPALQKAAEAARARYLEAAQASGHLSRVIEALEERARRADEEIAAAVRDLEAASMAYATGEAKRAWQADYVAAAAELVRQLARGWALGATVAGKPMLFQLTGLAIPNPSDFRQPLYNDEVHHVGLPGMSGSVSELATSKAVLGDWLDDLVPLVKIRSDIARHKPYSPPKPPQAPYEQRSYTIRQPGDPASRPADYGAR